MANDVIIGNAANNILDGGAGRDFFISSELLVDVSIAKASGDMSFTVNSQEGGTDLLINVERIIFADKGVALDFDDAAGQTAKLLGSVFGIQSVQNSQYAKIGLDLLDDGMLYQDLAALCLQAAGATSHAQIVELLWFNLLGSKPTVAQAQPYIDMLDQGMSTGGFGVMVADLDLNMNNINFLGLSQSGLVFDLA